MKTTITIPENMSFDDAIAILEKERDQKNHTTPVVAAKSFHRNIMRMLRNIFARKKRARYNWDIHE